MITDKKKEIIITTDTKEDGTDDPNAREMWAHPCEFFLSCLGYAVGYGNIWRFPYLCFKNGGAAFLIPYVVILVIAGIPMFFMEFALGQYTSMSPALLFPELTPIFSGLGWAMILAGTIICIYFNVIFAWSLFYLFASFQSVLPWSHCDNDFNSLNCYSNDDVFRCRNISMFYFNKTCHSVEDYCSIANMETYNETHCHNGEFGTVAAEMAVPIVSSSEDYYRNRVLGVTGTTWEDMGGMNWEITGCLALSWLLLALCMIKGIKSTGKAIYFFALFPYVVLSVFIVRGLTLKGSYEGIKFYILQPNISKLAEIQVWNDAATQIFYSLGIAYGSLITLSSYNKHQNNCMRDAITVSLSNCATSVFAGFAIFSILGFMASEIDVPVKDVVDSGSGLAFVAYPAAISRMPYPAVWSVLFFSMLMCLGIDSQFTFVETLAAALFDSVETLRPKKPFVMVGLCFILFLLGLPFCLNGGIYLLELINIYATGIPVFFIAICEVVCVVYIYGMQKFKSNITKEMGISLPNIVFYYWKVMWQIFTPLSLAIIFCLGIYYFEPVGWGSYVFPQKIQFLGWLTTIGTVAPIPIFATYVYFCTEKKGKELLAPTEKFCPAFDRKRRQTEPKEEFKYVYDNNMFSSDNVKVYPITDEIKPSETSNLDIKNPESSDNVTRLSLPSSNKDIHAIY